MIVYHKNDEIDRELWDNCIKNSHSHRPYAYSWYLDRLSPGWEALVDDDYDSVFPVPLNTRFGIKFTATPPFLQQLGAFSPDKPAANAIIEFLDYMPEVFRLTDLNVGQKVEYPGYKVTEKSNYELSLSPHFEKLWDSYTPECRKYISTASKKGYVISGNVSPEELMSIYPGNLGFSLRGVKSNDYDRLLDLIRYCLSNGKGSILGVRTPRKKLVYGIFMIKIPGSITIVLESNTARSVEKHIGFLVINEIIKENSTIASRLDFAGTWDRSAVPVGKSFGGKNIPYYRIFRNRLLLPARLLK